ncbi:MAG: ADP-ribosylglycohydrolase family protein [Spirochaetota bacterium]
MKKISDQERIVGCIKGKAIGGTLGTPLEGKMVLMNHTFYDPIPTGILPNDDFDLQLLFLEAVENAGGIVDSSILARWWIEKVQFPWDEYGVANLNIRRGFVPPLTGFYDNPFRNCMGSPIRSELWAMLAPRRPALAAYFAMQDAMVDHYLEGMAGEMFFAAFESAAFEDKYTIDELIAIGLSYTPKKSQTYAAVRFALDTYRTCEWPALREKILEKFGHPNFTEAPQNIAFTIIGLLYYPNDFDKALLSTANCGYDTDCTAATIGAMWGVMRGDNFPQRWLTPIGENMLASHGVTDMSVATTINTIADQVSRVRMLVEKRYAKMTDAALKKAIQAALDKPTMVKIDRNSDITIDYGKSPVLSGTKKIPFTGGVKAAFAKYPFTAKVVKKTIIVGIDKKAPFVPTHAKITVETRTGEQYEFGLVTPHELSIGYYDSPEGFADIAKRSIDDLTAEKKLAPFTLEDRSLLLKDLKDSPWIHLVGYFHLGSYAKYRLAPFCECPMISFIDGEQSHRADEGRACIPAPHRGGGAMMHDRELKGGWHRWDIFLNKAKPIRGGEVCITISDAYTKMLTDFRFQRKPCGVYKY